MQAARYRWMALFLSTVVLVFVILINMWYTNHVDQQSNQKWCSILAAVVARDAPPPTTPRSQKIRDDIQQLHHDYGCDDK